MEEMKIKVVSCFSYKGGAGRSTLTINLVPFLADALDASAAKPLVLVDMDIDSCGLTYLYDLDEDIDRNYNVQYLFGQGTIPREDRDTTKHSLFKHLKAVGRFYGRDDRSILCLPANPGASLAEQTSNYEGDSDRCLQFIDECNRVGCCGVLLDSAVGDQLTARWSNSYASHILCCMRPTKQFREGTKKFMDHFDDTKSEKTVIIVPNVVPTDELTLTEDGTLRKYPDYAREQLLEAFQENVDNDENTYVLELVTGDTFGIPKIDRFMWQEGILDNLPKSELTECEKLALKQYRKIADLVCKY